MWSKKAEIAFPKITNGKNRKNDRKKIVDKRDFIKNLEKILNGVLFEDYER